MNSRVTYLRSISHLSLCFLSVAVGCGGGADPRPRSDSAAGASGAGGAPGAGGTGFGGTGGGAGGTAGGGGGGGGGGTGGSGGSGGSGGVDAAIDAAGAGGRDGSPPVASDAPSAARGMRIYWIDVEGGAATLIVSPTNETLLVDAGWSGARDTGRIVNVLDREVGKMQLDYFVATHYHVDHVGGIGNLARAVPIMNFVDHGNSVEGGDGGYAGAIGPMRRMRVQPGQKIMLGAVEITVVTAAGAVVDPLPSAAPNPLCQGAQNKNDSPDEDPQSVGILARLGSFEFLDLGDLTWGVESRLACPMNRLGQVDLFQSSQHGSAESNPPQLVHALAPLAIVVNCGASKGGEAMAMQTFRSSPGMKDVWQVHRSNAAGNANSEDALIANPAGPDQAHWLRATIDATGAFQITNGRTGMSRTYQSR